MNGSVESQPEPRSPAAVPPGKPRRFATLGFAVVVIATVAGVFAFARPRANPDVVWTRAKDAFEARDFPEADRYLQQLATLRTEPTPLDYMLRAQVALGMNRDDQAFADLKQVPDTHPMAPAARLEMGQMELRRSRLAAAETYFLQALKREPTQIQARRELVYIYGLQLRRADLNATFRLLSETSNLTDSEVFLWCLTRGVTWEPDEIVKSLGKAIEADPNDRWSRLGRASSYLDMSRPDEAEATLTPLPDSDPDARAIRVRVALTRGDDQAAETLLDGGPDDHPGLALLRGQLALARGDARGALHHFRIAYGKAPFLREAVFGLGKALQLNGDPTAATYLDQALKLDLLGSLMQKAAVPANRVDPTLIRDLGAACAAVGRIPEARAWYSIAINRDPLDVKAQQALARLGPPDPVVADPG